MPNEVEFMRLLRNNINSKKNSRREFGRVEANSSGDVEIDLSQVMEEDTIDDLPENLEFDVPADVAEIFGLNVTDGEADDFTLALQRLPGSTVFRIRAFQ